VVKLVGKTTTLNQINVIPEIIRGGLYTVVGSGGVTEAAISTGGLLGYSLPPGKKAKFKGTLVVTVFGGNNVISVNVFDNAAGRIVAVGSAGVADIFKTIEFEGTLENDDFDFTINGDSGLNNGQCAVLVSIQELPA